MAKKTTTTYFNGKSFPYPASVYSQYKRIYKVDNFMYINMRLIQVTGKQLSSFTEEKRVLKRYR